MRYNRYMCFKKPFPCVLRKWLRSPNFYCKTRQKLRGYWQIVTEIRFEKKTWPPTNNSQSPQNVTEISGCAVHLIRSLIIYLWMTVGLLDKMIPLIHNCQSEKCHLGFSPKVCNCQSEMLVAGKLCFWCSKKYVVRHILIKETARHTGG